MALTRVSPQMQSRDFESVTALLADTVLAYAGTGTEKAVAGDTVVTRTGGFSYEIAASGAVDQHITTAGGVKLYVNDTGAGKSVEAFGAIGDGATDNTTAIQTAINSFPASGYGRLSFEGGTYNVSATIATNGRGITIDGNGSALRLTATTTYMLTVNSVSVSINDLKLAKAIGVTASAVNVTGIRHVFSNVGAANALWTDVFHCVDAKECHWENCNLYNDTAGLTGSIFKLDHCVNNTWNALFMGFCEEGFYCTTTAHPINGYKSEGVQISNSILVYCNKGVRGDSVTNLAVSNCVFDFCGAQGIFCTNGQAMLIANNWFAGSTNVSFIAIGIGASYNYGTISGNFITEGGTSLASAKGLSLAGGYINVMGNVFSNIAGGISTNSTSKNIGNSFAGGKAEITSSSNIRLDNLSYVKNALTTGSSYRADSPLSFTGSNFRSDSATAGSPTAWAHMYGTSSSASVASFYIRGNGNMENGTGSYGVFSDEKLKQDITDAGSQWDDIKNIRFRKYRLKTEVAENPNAYPMFGIVAQELELTSPGLVSDSQMLDEEGEPTGETVKSVKQSILLMKAAKALQEAMERIEALEARMAAL